MAEKWAASTSYWHRSARPTCASGCRSTCRSGSSSAFFMRRDGQVILNEVNDLARSATRIENGRVDEEHRTIIFSETSRRFQTSPFIKMRATPCEKRVEQDDGIV